MKVLRMETK